VCEVTLPGGHLCATPRSSIEIAVAYVNARDWRRLQHSVASTAYRIILCSHLEVDQSGFNNAVDIVTAFRRPVQPAGHQEVGDPLVLLFQGELSYAPNVDAALWLVRAGAFAHVEQGSEFRTSQTHLSGFRVDAKDSFTVAVRPVPASTSRSVIAPERIVSDGPRPRYR
jgi:hypothetical protein